MFSLGSTIEDKAGLSWSITKIWEFENYLCLGLAGNSIQNFGQMGGARFEIESTMEVNK